MQLPRILERNCTYPRVWILYKMGYFAVSQPGLNFSNTEAILYIDHGCVRTGDLCGGGGYILMRKVNGVWSVVDQFSTWVS